MCPDQVEVEVWGNERNQPEQEVERERMGQVDQEDTDQGIRKLLQAL